MVADVAELPLDWTQKQWSILDGVILGMAHWAEVYDPAMVEGDQCLEQEVWVTAGHTMEEMYVINWVEAQRKNPMLSAVLDWLKTQKQRKLRMLLAEPISSKEGKLILWNWQNFMIQQGTLYLCSTPKSETEDLLLFVVPKAHCVAMLNGCNQDAGHEGHDHMLSLLQECFWWPGMTNPLQKSIRTCMHCL